MAQSNVVIKEDIKSQQLILTQLEIGPLYQEAGSVTMANLCIIIFQISNLVFLLWLFSQLIKVGLRRLIMHQMQSFWKMVLVFIL